MTTDALVTVVVPVYNAETTVAKTVASLQAQTYKNLDILLINDGSTDNSLEICEKLASEDLRVRVHDQENAGVSAVRNKGIELAKGTYLAFADSDDVFDPKMIEVLLENMVKENADISVCSYQEIDSQDTKLPVIEYKSVTTKVMNSSEAINEALMNKIPLFVWGKLYRTELFQGVSFPVGRIFEDEITALKLFKKAAKTVSVEAALYYYVQNTGGLTKCPKQKHAFDLLQNEAEIEEMLKDSDIDKKALYARLCSNYTLAYNIVYKCSNDAKLLKEIRQKNNACYKNTASKYVKRQPNGTSVILLRLGLYRVLLGIRKTFSKKASGNA